MTGFGKTLRTGFIQKIEFDAWLISSIIELTHVQVFVLVCGDTALCLRSRHTPIIKKLRSKGIAMHAYGVSAYYRDPEIN